MKKYIIDCWNGRNGGCKCLNGEAQCCDRGFFSLFIQAVNGIDFAVRNNLQPYVDFGSINYLFSDPERFSGDTNFWNYYFEQPVVTGSASFLSAVRNIFRREISYNRKNEVLPVKDWAPGVIAHKSRIVSENIRFKPEVRGYLANIENRFSAYSRIMGMHLRRTDHIAEHPTAATERYLDLAKAHSDRYDAFFVATDDHATLESIIAALGHDRVLYLDVIRSSDGNPVHKNLAQPNRFQLGLEALADCYALSLCQKAILTQSNLSYAAVLFNPGLEYIVL